MSTTEEGIGITSPFGGSVNGDERELAIDESVCASSAVPSSQICPRIKSGLQGGRGVREESIGRC